MKYPFPNQTLDRIDARLLHLLDKDARISSAELSRELKLGSDLINYRITRLTQSRVIVSMTPVVDPYRLGFQVYKIYFKLSGDREKTLSFIQHLHKDKHTYWLSEWYGRWDLIVSFWSSSPNRFFRKQERILSRYSDLIHEMDIFTTFHVQRHSRTFLQNQEGSSIAFGEERSTVTVDETDLVILQALSGNARLSSAEIGRLTQRKARIVRYRIEKLKELGVLKGFRTQLGATPLKIMTIKILVEKVRFSVGTEKKLREFCRKRPESTCYIRQIGRHSIEIEVEVFSFEDLHHFIDSCRSAFEPELGRVEYLIQKKDWGHRIPFPL